MTFNSTHATVLLMHPLLASIGILLLKLHELAGSYGYYLLFRYGSEAQCEPFIQAALQRRAANQQVILVPVMTTNEGVPLDQPKTEGTYVN